MPEPSLGELQRMLLPLIRGRSAWVPRPAGRRARAGGDWPR
jgi:hypothetical protein